MRNFGQRSSLSQKIVYPLSDPSSPITTDGGKASSIGVGYHATPATTPLRAAMYAAMVCTLGSRYRWETCMCSSAHQRRGGVVSHDLFSPLHVRPPQSYSLEGKPQSTPTSEHGGVLVSRLAIGADNSCRDQARHTMPEACGSSSFPEKSHATQACFARHRL